MKQDSSPPATTDSDNAHDSEFKIRLARRGLGKRVRLCPNCLSPVRLTDSLAGWMTPEEYICEKCGYRGPVYVEPRENEQANASESD